MAKEIEGTKIYKTYVDFIFYIELITEKYPNSSKSGMVSNIKNSLYDGLKNILCAYKCFESSEKLKYLNELDINLKMLKVYARVSYKKKYINIKNYEAWSRKINKICALLGGWINSCLRR